MSDRDRDDGNSPAGELGSGRLLPNPAEADSTERWVRGKSRDELLSDLRVYLARLRDDPHNIQDRLRVAAIQLRLGRIDEALIHYEGVLRGYVINGQILSAIALCERILRIYPDLPRLQRILAALYARAPRGSSAAPAAVTPIEATKTDEEAFVLTEQAATREPADTVVSRIFKAPPSHSSEIDRRALLHDETFQPSLEETSRVARPLPPQPAEQQHRRSSRSARRRRRRGPKSGAKEGSEHVVLLTRPKPKRDS